MWQLATDRGEDPSLTTLFEEDSSEPKPKPIFWLALHLGVITGRPMSAVCEEAGMYEDWDEDEDSTLDHTARAALVCLRFNTTGRMLHEQSLTLPTKVPKPIVIKLLGDYSERRDQAQLEALLPNS